MGVLATRFTPQAVLGLLIILVGLLLTADNLHYIEADHIIRFWPLGIVIVGLVKLAQSSAGSGRIVGALIIFVGAVLTADVSFGLPVQLDDFWPVVLIGLGLVILFRTLRPEPPRAATDPTRLETEPDQQVFGAPPDLAREAARKAREGVAGVMGTTATRKGDESVSEVAVWAGKQRRVSSSAFKRADLTAIMGGVEVDLRAAATADGEAIIDVFVMWGGVEIWVPPDWAVVNKVGVLMGGVEDKSTGMQDARHRLIVRGFVIMGGLEIKT